MAELYPKPVGDVTFQCYSERGLVAYYMFRVLPRARTELLRKMENGVGECPFSSSASSEISKLTIFSELDFGEFGNPDGALFFEASGHPHMIFYEAKLNEDYQQSCKRQPYYSTIKGQ